MKTNLYIPIILFLAIILNIKAAYPQDANRLKTGQSLTYKAMIINNKDLLVKADSIFKNILKFDSSNTAALYGSTYVEYRLLEMSLQKGNEDLFSQYYQHSIDNAKKLISMDKYSSEGKSLLAGIYMMKIASSPLTAVTLSQEINQLLDDAEIDNPQNPMPFIIRGEMRYSTPKAFGGSYEDAAKSFNKAIAICEQNPESGLVDKSWANLESLAWLGRSLVQLENYDAAKFAYQKALNLQPDFGWVKYVLLPEVEKKIQN
jgi:tetratricopeptide (TPR) repeat protein